VQIDLPPLRDRPGDIDVLAEHFLQEQAGQLGRVFAGFSSAALAALRAYAFPGNVRELSNVVERAAVLARGQTIQPEDLPPHVARAAAGGTAPGGPGTNPLRIAGSHEPAWDGLPLEAALREPERRILLAALEANLWNRQATADALGINRTTLYKKMKTLGIDDAGRAAG
jgi:DNA-binding NtrC family response regulator